MGIGSSEFGEVTNRDSRTLPEQDSTAIHHYQAKLLEKDYQRSSRTKVHFSVSFYY